MTMTVERKDASTLVLDVGWASTGTSLATLLAGAVASASTALGREMVGLLRLLPDRQNLLLEAGVGWRPGVVGEARLQVGSDDALARALATGEPVAVPPAPVPLSQEPGVGGGTVVRVGQEGRPYGLLAAYSNDGGPAATDGALLST